MIARNAVARLAQLGVMAAMLAGLCLASGSVSALGAAGPQSGGTFTYVTSSNINSFDPIRIQGFPSLNGDGPWAYAVFDTLLYESLDGKIVPKLAKSISSPDGVVWTLKLREGVKFSDGTPLDAAAVRFNYQRAMDPANRSFNLTRMQQIKSVEAVDPLTVRITLQAAFSQFPRLMAITAPMIYIGSPKAIQANSDGFGANPVGAGPFTMESWVRDSEARFSRNPDYWDAPKPYVRELVMRLVLDVDQKWNVFTTGQATTINPIGDFAVRAKEGGYPVAKTGSTLGSNWAAMNDARAPFSDIRARQALHMAVDPKRWVQLTTGGRGEARDTLYPPGSQWYDKDMTLPRYDPKAAQKLFDEVASAQGHPVEFTAVAPTSLSPQPAEILQALLSSYRNVKVNIRLTTPQEFQPTVFRGDFDIGFGVPGAGSDPSPGFGEWFLKGAPRNTAAGGYSNPDADRAISILNTSVDDKERRAAFRTLDRTLVRDLPVWFSPAFTAPLYTPYQKNVQGIAAGHPGNQPFFEQFSFKRT